MLKTLWHEAIYQPLYNGLIFISNIIPTHDIGITIIVLTILVKLALYPIAKKGIVAQQKMKRIEGELQEAKEKHKADKQAQAQATMALYKKHGVNPAAGCLPALLQIPIIIGLYYVFSKHLTVDPTLLYSFISAPENLNLLFLGFVDISKKNLFLAIFAGLTQHLQARFSQPNTPSTDKPKTQQEEFARAMQMQMKYMLPFMITFFAYSLSAGVALYWSVGNIVSIVQDIWVKRHLKASELKPDLK